MSRYSFQILCRGIEAEVVVKAESLDDALDAVCRMGGTFLSDFYTLDGVWRRLPLYADDPVGRRLEEQREQELMYYRARAHRDWMERMGS